MQLTISWCWSLELTPQGYESHVPYQLGWVQELRMIGLQLNGRNIMNYRF